MRPTLLLGTGRCGSTLVSEMIRIHPRALSISELFSFLSDLGMRIEQAFPDHSISANDFWNLLSQAQPRQSLLLVNKLQMKEVTYDLKNGRFRPADVPPILQSMLPHLDPLQPDQLFDSLEGPMINAPDGLIGDHYNRLFEHLMMRFGKTTWVERSGGGLRMTARLRRIFPEANIIHLVRDGRDTALSMSKHIGFRMALLCATQVECLGTDPYENADRSDEADLTDELAGLLPEHFNTNAFEQFDLPPALCGHYWSGEILSGLAELESMSSERLMTIRYEDIISSPRESVSRIGEFIDHEVSAEWVQQAAALVQQKQPRWVNLSAYDRDALADACRPGFDALATHGLKWG